MNEKLGTREAQCSSVEYKSLRTRWTAKSIWTGLHVTNPVLSCCSTMCRAIARIGSSRKKGAGTQQNATSFKELAWQVMVAAAVEPELLVFVDEMGSSYLACTDLRLRTKRRATAAGSASQPGQEHDAAVEHDHWWDGIISGRRRSYHGSGVRNLRREGARAELAYGTDRRDGQSRSPQAKADQGVDREAGVVNCCTCRPTHQTTTPSRKHSARSRTCYAKLRPGAKRL